MTTENSCFCVHTLTHTHLASVATLPSVKPFAARLKCVSEHLAYEEKKKPLVVMICTSSLSLGVLNHICNGTCEFTCVRMSVRCCSGKWSAALLRTADKSRCVRQWRGRVFNTSSKPVEPSALWERHTDLRWPVPERSKGVFLFRLKAERRRFLQPPDITIKKPNI